jgi:hypothetical protein
MKTLIIVRKSILIVLLTFFVFKSNVILSQKNNTKDNKKPADTVKIVDTNSETLNKLKEIELALQSLRIQLDQMAKDAKPDTMPAYNKVKGLSDQLKTKDSEITGLKDRNMKNDVKITELENERNRLKIEKDESSRQLVELKKENETAAKELMRTAVFVSPAAIESMKKGLTDPAKDKLTKFNEQAGILKKAQNILDNTVGADISNYKKVFEEAKFVVISKTDFEAQFLAQEKLKVQMEKFVKYGQSLETIIIKNEKAPTADIRDIEMQKFVYKDVLFAFPYLKEKFEANKKAYSPIVSFAP